MLQKLLPVIDLLGIPVAMNSFGREKATTKFGGICSILLFFFIGWSIYNASQDLISTLNPKIVSYDFYRDDPRALDITSESFPISFAVQTPDTMNYLTFKDPSIFKIRMTHNLVQRHKDEQGDLHNKWTSTNLLVENCTYEHFASQASTIKDMTIKPMYCIGRDQPQLDKLQIQGIFSSNTYQEIVVEVLTCNNKTSDIPCASPEKINQYLNGGFFNFVFVNMVVNPQNYTSPNNTFKDIRYTMISPNTFKEAEFQLGYVEVTTDSGWLAESIHVKSYIKLNEIIESLKTEPRDDNVIFRSIIRMNQLETYYTRSYKKIQEVLAEVASMASTGLMILVIVTTPYLRLKYNEKLINEVFDVVMPQKTDKERKNRDKNKKKQDKGKMIKDKEEKRNERRNGIKSLDMMKVKMGLNSDRSGMIVDQSVISKARDQVSARNLLLPTTDIENQHSIKAEPLRKSLTFNSFAHPKISYNAVDMMDLGEDKVNNNDNKTKNPFEASILKIRESKVNLAPNVKKSLFVEKNPSPAIKSLPDDLSLHLSFISDRYQDEHGNTKISWTPTDVRLENCTYEYFASQASSIQDMNIKSLYCVAKEQPELEKLQIQGIFSSNTYQEIVVEVLACDNTTSEVTCATPEKINRYLNGGFFNFVFVNMVVNPQNFTSPNNTFKDIRYTMMSPKTFKEAEYQLGYVEVTTDSGWLVESLDVKSYIKLNQIIENLKTEPREDKVLLRATIKMNQLETYYTRTYKRIQGVLAEVAGMANAALVVLILLTTPYLKLKYNETLMNEVFEMKIPQNNENQRRKGKRKYTAGPTKTIAANSEGSKRDERLRGMRMKSIGMEPVKTDLNSKRNAITEELEKKIITTPRDHFSPRNFLLPTTEIENREFIKVDLSMKSSSPRLTHSKTNENNINNTMDSGENHIKSPVHKVKNESEAAISKIRNSKANLASSGKKSILIGKNQIPAIKALPEEHSLHLSFSSADFEDEKERGDLSGIKSLTVEKGESEQKKEVYVHVIENKINEEEKKSQKVEENIKKRASGQTASQKLELSVWDYLSAVIFRRKENCKKVEFLEEGIKNINQRLDIINVIKKLREVDKLRTLLLDHDQLLMFNNLPKPEIRPKSSRLARSSAPHTLLKDAKFVEDKAQGEEILHSFQVLKKKKLKSDIDMKLIEIFEERSAGGSSVFM